MNNSVPQSFDVVYLGLFPVEHKSEGLNVLLCDTIKPLMDQGVHVRIHTTRRHFKAIERALDGNAVDMSRLEIVAYRVQSITLVFFAALNRFAKKKKTPAKKQGLLSRLKQWTVRTGKASVYRLGNWFLDLTVWNFIFKLVLSLVLLAVAIPVGIVAMLLLGILGFFVGIGLLVVKKIFRKFRTYMRNRPKLKAQFLDFLQWKKRTFLLHMHNNAYAKEQMRFSQALNRNRKIKNLFFFTAFEGHVVANFKGSSLAVFPDMVMSLFPLRYEDAHNAYHQEAMRLTVAHANAIVCYSEFVRDQQLLRFFPKEAEDKRIEVIPQGYFPATEISAIHKASAAKDLNAYRSYIINPFPNLLLGPPTVDFTQFDFVLYPTIDRPHKNTLILVKAFAKLLREQYRNIKLVLTTPASSSDVKQYIVKNRLQYDVIYMPSVPIKVLDSLFEAATLMVHPSLAEGGDIFNFSRAVATGTPALLSDIPVVREMFDRGEVAREQYADWVFDPTDTADLFERMDKVLSRSESVVDEQKRVFDNLSRYGFGEMASRYFDLYTSL